MVVKGWLGEEIRKVPVPGLGQIFKTNVTGGVMTSLTEEQSGYSALVSQPSHRSRMYCRLLRINSIDACKGSGESLGRSQVKQKVLEARV